MHTWCIYRCLSPRPAYRESNKFLFGLARFLSPPSRSHLLSLTSLSLSLALSLCLDFPLSFCFAFSCLFSLVVSRSLSCSLSRFLLLSRSLPFLMSGVRVCSRLFLHVWYGPFTCHVIYEWVVDDASHVIFVTYEWGMSHLNEACHTWMRHVTHEWGMTNMNGARHTWMRHVTYEWGMPHMNEARHTWMGHVTHEWGMTHMNEARYTWMRHVTHGWGMPHLNEAWHTWMRHVTHEWGMSHLQQSFDISCYECIYTYTKWHNLIYEIMYTIYEMRYKITYTKLFRIPCYVACGRIMSNMHKSCHIWMSHVTHVYVTWFIHIHAPMPYHICAMHMWMPLRESQLEQPCISAKQHCIFFKRAMDIRTLSCMKRHVTYE